MTEKTTLIDIPLNDFTKTSSLKLEVYLKLASMNPPNASAEHFVKLAHGAEDLDADRVKELESRGIDRLYLSPESFDHYIAFERKILRAAAQSPKLEAKKKLNVIRTTLNHILRRAFSSERTVVDLPALQEVLFDSLEMLQALPTGDKLIECLHDLPDDLFNHSSLTAILSLLIAKELKWASPITLHKVAMVGLFHDLGFKNLPHSARFTHPQFLDPQTLLLYKTHCTRSAEALSQIGGFSADVILSIQQHHERLDGSGFPKGLSMRSIQPLALLIAVSDVFLDECYLLEDRSKVRIESILRRLTETHSQKLPADALLALCRVFRVRLDERVTWNLIRGGLNIGS